VEIQWQSGNSPRSTISHMIDIVSVVGDRIAGDDGRGNVRTTYTTLHNWLSIYWFRPMRTKIKE
jgi:hypothetical protein